jgi:Fe-S cluster biogenesis protein NfuA
MSDEQESNTLESKVAKVLDEIRPALQRDGGDVRLVDVVDGVVQVELQGACKGCPMSQMTLAFGIGRVLKSRIPEVVDIKPV